MERNCEINTHVVLAAVCFLMDRSYIPNECSVCKRSLRPSHSILRQGENATHMKISKWLVLALCVLGVGSLGFYLWHARAVRKARHWPTTEATVTSCQVASRTNLTQGKLGNHVVRWDDLAFAFTYTVSGRDYVSGRFYLMGNPSAQTVARDFPVGRKFLAQYDAAFPMTAVVKPGPLSHRALIAGCVCIGLAVGGMFYNRRWA